MLSRYEATKVSPCKTGIGQMLDQQSTVEGKFKVFFFLSRMGASKMSTPAPLDARPTVKMWMHSNVHQRSISLLRKQSCSNSCMLDVVSDAPGD